MGFLLWPTRPAPTARAAEKIRFSTGHKPLGFAGSLLLPGIFSVIFRLPRIAEQHHDACADNL